MAGLVGGSLSRLLDALIGLGALTALWGIWMDRYVRGRRHRRERRTYACPHCRGWHLTSQPKRR